MARSRMAAVTETVRGGLEDVSSRAGDVAQVIADRVGEAIETAGDEGRRLQKQLGKQISKRWKVLDKAGRENPYTLALGALAVGVAIGYLITRDRSPKNGSAPEQNEDETPATEMGL